MGVPAQALKQLEEAEKVQAELYGNTEKAEADNAPKAPEEQKVEVKIEEAPPVEPKAEEPPPQEETPAQPISKETDWEQKYKVLQGKYNKEVKKPDETGQLRAQISEMQRANMELTNLVRELQTKITTPQVQPQQAPAGDPAQYLDPEDISMLEDEGFDNRVIGVIAKMAMRIAANSTSEVKTEIAATAQDRFWDHLETAIPGWEQINNDPDFHQWLAQIIPYTNMTRQQILDKAQKEFNSGMVINIFRDFVNETVMPQQEEPIPQRRERVNPPRSKTVSQHHAASNEGRIYTPDEIQSIYGKIATGAISGEEAEKLDRDITLAGNTGRIRL